MGRIINLTKLPAPYAYPIYLFPPPLPFPLTNQGNPFNEPLNTIPCPSPTPSSSTKYLNLSASKPVSPSCLRASSCFPLFIRPKISTTARQSSSICLLASPSPSFSGVTKGPIAHSSRRARVSVRRSSVDFIYLLFYFIFSFSHS